MENLKLGIELENGNLKDFYFDSLIIDGLFFLGDSKKVTENCKAFDIKIDKSNKTDNSLLKNISKKENVVIITYYFDENNQTQYLVGNDLNINEFNNLNENEFVQDDKDIVRQAFSLF